ncbi:MAG TPA: hypothetical protein VK464_11840, partial [Symbiobacteriaceae bacterium]|nr:hypothetical protein [Symbiobacteriaceae bacterium]
MRRPYATLIIGMVVAALLLSAGIYRWRAAAAFAAQLDSFELTVSRMGMPGRPATYLTVVSDGSVHWFEAVNGERTEEAEAKLSPAEVEQVRQSLRGLWSMSGEYKRPFWSQETDPLYLWFDVKGEAGAVKAVGLESTN